jgi:hypothetical protein
MSSLAVEQSLEQNSESDFLDKERSPDQAAKRLGGGVTNAHASPKFRECLQRSCKTRGQSAGRVDVFYWGENRGVEIGRAVSGKTMRRAGSIDRRWGPPFRMARDYHAPGTISHTHLLASDPKSRFGPSLHGATQIDFREYRGDLGA